MHQPKSNLTKCVILSFFILFLFSSFGINNNQNTFVVVLDAGHGGEDAGAKGYDGIREKDVTLDVALLVGELIKLKHKEVKVIYTRETDVFIPLQERARIANKNKANLFISIHCNANNKITASGTETFVLGLHRNDDNFEVSKRENSVIFLEDNYEEKYEGFDPRSPASVIGLTLMQNTHLDNSIQLAKFIEDNFSYSNRFSRGVKQAGFLVLRQTAMPSVLTEIGFITNPEEGSFLGSEEGKVKVAQDIYSSFKSYKEFVEDKSKVSFIQKKNEEKIEPKIQPKIEIKNEPKIEQNLAVNLEKPNPNKSYKIQFLNSKNRYKSGSVELKGLSPVEVVETNNSYKYYYGATNYESEKNRLLQTVKNAGFPDAFVVEVDKNASRETYTIQLLSTKKNIPLSFFEKKGLKNVIQIKEKGFFKYLYTKEASPEEIKTILKQIKEKIAKDAFIIYQ